MSLFIILSLYMRLKLKFIHMQFNINIYIKYNSGI